MHDCYHSFSYEKAHPWWSKGTFEMLLNAQKFHKAQFLCIFFLRIHSISVKEMQSPCYLIHQVSILTSSIDWRSCPPAAILKRNNFLPTHSSAQYIPSSCLLQLTERLSKVSSFEGSHRILKSGVIIFDLWLRISKWPETPWFHFWLTKGLCVTLTEIRTFYLLVINWEASPYSYCKFMHVYIIFFLTVTVIRSITSIFWN